MTFCLLVALVAALAQAAPPKAVPDPAAFGRGVIDLLSYARDIIDAPEDKATNHLESSLNEMVKTRKAIARFRDGVTAIEPFADGPESTMTKAAEGFQLVLGALISGLEEHLAIQEHLLKAKTQDDVAALVPRASKVAARVDESWRVLPKVIILATFALVDDKRLVDGKLPYLKITSDQRKELIASLTEMFPKAKPGGGHAVDVSASLLLEWLKGNFKASDE